MTVRTRQWYYRTLQVAKREVGMDDDSYRDVLMAFGATEKDGKFSATTLTIPQLEKVLSHFKTCGFKMKRAGAPKSFKDGQLRKCQAMWIELHKAGVFHQPYSEAALTKFAARMTGGVANIRWASPTGLAKTIEALKGIANREGVKNVYP